MDIKITKTTAPKPIPKDDSKLGFGRVFSDHMFIMPYDRENGWHNAEIKPFGDISLSPAAMVLHYGQEIFEGLKAYRTASGDIQLFRPEKNFERLNVSAKRLVIPEIPVEDAMQALTELVKLDKDWVPHSDGASLYIRPFVFAVDPFVGVRPGDYYYFIIITSPSGPYYSTGLSPVGIYVEENYVRAVKGGMGYTKTGGNYAASLAGQDEAHKQNFSQVLWLDGVERKYVEEVGAMNIFFVIDDEIITPVLEGSVLPGITRISAIELCKKWGYKVTERKISIEEIARAHNGGALKEVFGTGTAAVISPVGVLKWGDNAMTINDDKMGDISKKLYDTLTGIQYSKIPDDMGWVRKIKF
ncbi:MAG: branched-chain amino acid aminotransferase [Eubacterium sp.]|jgi:branched-chain amino acid aminotransferase|nr:branched-chain amino acid aminotransferase [Eubacterium sp.]